MTITDACRGRDGGAASTPDDGEVARLGAATGEDDAAGLGPDERRDLVAGLFDRSARVARGAVAPEGLPTTPCCQRSMASATSSRRGAEAA